jgi:SAM-dependent methyltransferase
MSRSRETFDEWCSKIPGLSKVGELAWVDCQPTTVSYPESGLHGLANIESASYWFKHRNNVIATVVKRFPPDGIIVDFGGGNGFVSLGLEQAGYECVVVEPDANGSIVANQRGLPVIRATLQTLNLPENSIAAIGMFDVLEHIEEDLGALKKINRILRLGGRAYITVPAYNFLWSHYDKSAGHVLRYTVARLKQNLQKVGFTTEYATYFFTALILPVLILRSIPYRFRNLGVTEDVEGDHRLPSGLIGTALEMSFRRELQIIASAGRIALGTSCIVVARKTASFWP